MNKKFPALMQRLHLVILVDRKWAAEHPVEHVSILPGVMHAVRWTSPAGPCISINFDLEQVEVDKSKIFAIEV